MKNVLRHNVVVNRKVAWRWQARAGLARSRTRHHELRASVDYLHHLVRMWHDRAYAAMKATKSGASSGGTVAVDSCLRTLIGREGGMNPHAYNASSGAYGAPQALPGSKMASAGADWRDNLMTQIRWMVGYVNSRWGGSCAALAHSYSYGWY